jgi:hypothetical protein
MKTYHGITEGTLNTYVLVHDGRGDSWPLTHYARHSPTGFSWGYSGSGPSDLARCVLIDHFGLAARGQWSDEVYDPTTGEQAWLPVSYQNFKFDVIAKLPQNEGWTLTSEDVAEWVAANETGTA